MDADTVISSIKFGGLSGKHTPQEHKADSTNNSTGCTGLLYGGASGILRASKHPIVHTLAHGIHFSIWGTSFWCTSQPPCINFREGKEGQLTTSTVIRSNILHFHYQNEATQQQRKYVSAISGGLSGGAITKLMGTSRPLPSITYLGIN